MRPELTLAHSLHAHGHRGGAAAGRDLGSAAPRFSPPESLRKSRRCPHGGSLGVRCPQRDPKQKRDVLLSSLELPMIITPAHYNSKYLSGAYSVPRENNNRDNRY